MEMEATATDRAAAFTLDIGGEGRHHDAWNLNPSLVKTRGPDRGSPIPRLIRGRSDAIPLADNSVDRIIVERTPLRVDALREINRVVSPRGTIILRHAVPPGVDPHRTAAHLLRGRMRQRKIRIHGTWVQESEFQLGATAGNE